MIILEVSTRNSSTLPFPFTLRRYVRVFKKRTHIIYQSYLVLSPYLHYFILFIVSAPGKTKTLIIRPRSTFRSCFSSSRKILNNSISPSVNHSLYRIRRQHLPNISQIFSIHNDRIAAFGFQSQLPNANKSLRHKNNPPPNFPYFNHNEPFPSNSIFEGFNKTNTLPFNHSM